VNEREKGGKKELKQSMSPKGKRHREEVESCRDRTEGDVPSNKKGIWERPHVAGKLQRGEKA